MKLYHKTPLLPLVLAVVLFGALAIAALSDEPPAPAPAAAQSASADPDALDWTGTAQKWVPIISVEQGGLSVGAAQIARTTLEIAGTVQMRRDLRLLASAEEPFGRRKV